MAIPPIDRANSTLATLAGHVSGRIAEANAAGPIGRLVRIIGVSEIEAQTPAATPQAPAAPQGQTRAQVVAQAAQQAVVKQDGLAPLLADLAQAVNSPNLPPAVRQAAARVLAQQTPLTAEAEAPDVAKALSGSGLLLEADLAANPAQSPVNSDLKAGLLLLRQALANAGPMPTRRNASGTRPPPPYRGGPTAGQRAAMPGLDRDSPDEVQRQRLAEETDSALARLELLQIASLPERDADPVSRWNFEAPVQTPFGAAVAQFEVSRDGRGRGGDAEAGPTWRARFGVDIEPLGPVTAHLTLVGGQLGVAIWAARPEGAALLKARAAELVGALAGPEVRADVAVYQGVPPAAPTSAGQLLDQAV